MTAYTAQAPQVITAVNTAGVKWATTGGASQAITAVNVAGVAWATKGATSLTVTASDTAVTSYGAVAVAPQVVTATLSNSWGISANAFRTITTSDTASTSWTTTANASQTITVSDTSAVRWSALAAATQTITATDTANVIWVTVGNVSLPMTLTPSADSNVEVLGPPLRYVGRSPDTTGTLCTVSYAQKDQGAYLVTSTWTAGQITSAVANLVNETWINQQVANYTTQTQVTTNLEAYIPTSSLGSTVAQLGSNGSIPTGQLPAVTLNNLALNYDVTTSGTVFLLPGISHTTTTTTLGELKIGTITIPNPGYPWIPYPFAKVLGYSSATSSGSRLIGTSNSGILTVTQQGVTSPLYGAGLFTDDPGSNYYSVVPAAIPLGPVTPLTQTPLTTGMTFELSGCNWTGTGYTYNGTGLIFFILVLPALSGV